MSHPQAECAFMAQDISAGRSSKNGAPWKQTDGRTNEPAAAQAAPVSMYADNTQPSRARMKRTLHHRVSLFFVFFL